MKVFRSSVATVNSAPTLGECRFNDLPLATRVAAPRLSHTLPRPRLRGVCRSTRMDFDSPWLDGQQSNFSGNSLLPYSTALFPLTLRHSGFSSVPPVCTERYTLRINRPIISIEPNTN
jgi:hypothetical protein